MKMQAPSTVIVVLEAIAMFALPPLAGAETFLGQASPGGLRGVPQELARPSLRAALEAALNASDLEAAVVRSARLEAALQTTFASLPKSEQETVGAAAARYALHRLFVQQHGWQLKGLVPSGGNWSTESPTAAFGDRVPEAVAGLFEDHVRTQGLTLHELALFAAMLEHMVHGQIESQLQAILRILNHPMESSMDEGSAVRVIDSYMASYILGANASAMTALKLWELNSNIEEEHPSWPETQRFLREVQREVRPAATAFNFSDVVAVVEEAADRFGQWQSKECLALKHELVSIEDSKGSGRVRLADFYGSAVNGGKWQFSETVGYLRQLGAIDDTHPSGPRVIIPNYIYSPTNCLASSSFYAVCCIDECEEVLDHLEASLGRPTATPEEIIELVSALPAASGNGTLPAGLAERLREVAGHHGGRVPLHGRLLAQWLHHARPRECPYPHVSGTTAPQRPGEWEARAGLGAVSATEDEMIRHIQAAQRQRPAEPAGNDEDGGLCSPMWSLEEELVDAHAHRAVEGRAGEGARRTAARSAALLAAAGSLAMVLVASLRQACAAGGLFRREAEKLPRYSV